MKTIAIWSVLVGYWLITTGYAAANKYGPTGWESNPEIDWARVFVQGALSRKHPPSFGGVDVAADSEVSCYVVGSFVGVRRFGSVTLTNHSYVTNTAGRLAPFWNAYLAKYDRQANFQWVQTFSNATTRRVVTRGQNEIFVVMNMFRAGSTTIGNHQVVGRRANEAFLAKFDRRGNSQWVSRAGASPTFGLAVNLAGECVVVGNIFGAAEFENLTLRTSNSRRVFIAKYRDNGELLWAKVVGGDDAANKSTVDFQVQGATVDWANNIYVAGTMHRPPSSVGGLPEAQTDVVLAKYDSEANPLWMVRPGGSGYRSAFNVAVDGASHPHIVGIFRGTTQYGSQSIKLESRNNTNIFHAKYSPGGELQWVRQFLPGDFEFNNVLSVEAHGINLTQIRSANATKLAGSKPATNVTTTAGTGAPPPALSVPSLNAALSSANVAALRQSPAPSVPRNDAANSTSTPQLNLFRSGDHLILYWPKESAGYVLESCDSLTPFQTWAPEPAAPQLVGEWLAVAVPIDRAMKFYHLR